MENPLRHGAFADIWKGRYRGRDVAAKALRVYSKGHVGQIRRVSYWCSRCVVYISELTVSRVEILQGGCDVECPSSPERVTPTRGDND